MMAHTMSSKTEVSHLTHVFNQLDTNKDGKLQYDELVNGSTSLFGEFAKCEVDHIFKLVDMNHHGEIDFSEFITATVNRGNLL